MSILVPRLEGQPAPRITAQRGIIAVALVASGQSHQRFERLLVKLRAPHRGPLVPGRCVGQPEAGHELAIVQIDGLGKPGQAGETNGARRMCVPSPGVHQARKASDVERAVAVKDEAHCMAAGTQAGGGRAKQAAQLGEGDTQIIAGSVGWRVRPKQGKQRIPRVLAAVLDGKKRKQGKLLA